MLTTWWWDHYHWFEDHRLDPQTGPLPGSFKKNAPGRLHLDHHLDQLTQNPKGGACSQLLPVVIQGWKPLAKTRQGNENHQNNHYRWTMPKATYMACDVHSGEGPLITTQSHLGFVLKMWVFWSHPRHPIQTSNSDILNWNLCGWISGMCILNKDPQWFPGKVPGPLVHRPGSLSSQLPAAVHCGKKGSLLRDWIPVKV